MPPATLNLSGRKFVVIPEREYRDLKSRAARNRKPERPKRRLSKQDRGDVAESERRLAHEPSIPADEVFKRLGL